MKKIFIATGLVGLMLTGLTSCKKLLDAKPQSQITGQVYFSNEGDFEPFVIGNYIYIRDIANNIGYGEERSEELIQGPNSRLTSIWLQTLTTTTNTVNYSSQYKAIGACNLLLDKIEPFSFTNAALKNKVKAEALCQRAFLYFSLVRIIGDTPLMLQAITDDNVPQLPRAKAADVMKQVFADLDKAISLFPDKTFPSKYRFSFGSAQALKAEAKLWSAKVLGGGTTDLNDAITAGQAVETTNATLLPKFADVTTVRANAEVLMSVYYQRDEAGKNYAVNALPYFSTVQGAANIDSIPYCNTTTNGQGGYEISLKSRQLFSGLTNDQRVPATFIVERQGTVQRNFWISKLPGTKYPDDRVADNDLILWRLADVYLMEAEAYAALNNTTQAITYLNKIRVRAGNGNYTGATDKASVEMEIFKERGREMFYENKRWYDIMRFHFGGTIDAYTYVPNLVGKKTPLYFALSSTVLAANSKLTQTPGY